MAPSGAETDLRGRKLDADIAADLLPDVLMRAIDVGKMLDFGADKFSQVNLQPPLLVGDNGCRIRVTLPDLGSVRKNTHRPPPVSRFRRDRSEHELISQAPAGEIQLPDVRSRERP